jgi:putative ABC transport system substrate-binding protein
MRRREVLTLIGGLAASGMWPLAARAQQPKLPVVGVLGGTNVDGPQVGAIRQGLGQAGYVEGRNVAFEYRWAQGHYDRLPALASDLVQRHVAAIVTIQGMAPVLAAKAATATIPIVFSTGGDAVKFGLVASLNHPGGNVTGVSFLVNTLGTKRLEVLRTLVPAAAAIGFLVNPANPNAEPETKDMQAAARAVELQMHVRKASSEQDIDAAFADFAERRVDALITTADSFFLSRRDQLIALTARNMLPAIYHVREIAAAGGLMSYGTSIVGSGRQAGRYVGRILKGERPADLPIQQSVKFELVINLKTAKALGLAMPDKLLAIADEVIE